MRVNLFELRMNKQLRYGGYATLSSLVVVVVLILINLVVGQLELEADLTENQLYTLSEQTYQAMGNITEPVIVYGVYQEGRQQPVVWAILQKYRGASDFITLDTIDPQREPALARRFDEDGTGLRNGSLIVAGTDRFRVISQFDLTSVNQQTGQAMSLNVEQKVTSALLYVSSADRPKIYSLQGHGEVPLYSLGLSQPLETENFDTDDLNLVQAGSVPSDASIVLVIGPREDLSEREAEQLLTYLDAGGRAMIVLDWQPNVSLPRFDSVLASYGVAVGHSYIIEGDTERHLPNQPLVLLPEVKSHAITAPLLSDRMLTMAPIASPLEVLEVRRRTTTVEELMTSSSRAWTRAEVDNPAASVTEPLPGETRGVSIVAAAITDRAVTGDEADTKLVVVTTSDFLAPNVMGQVPGNINFVMNSLNWLYDRTESISVRAKSLIQFRLRMTGYSSQIFAGVVVVLIPLGVLAAGLVVWLRRRHL